MAKESGLGDNFYLGGYNLSGDIGAIDTISGGPEALEVTGIDKSAKERIGGARIGMMEFTAWFNPAAAQAHPVLSALPTTDVVCNYARGTTLGDPGAGMVAKQVNYDGTRAADGAFSFKVSANANGYGLEWGDQLTAGSDNFTGSGAGTSIDYGATIGTTNFGLQAYLQVFAFTGTSATVAVQSSTDDGAGDAFADVTGAVFTAATGITAERIQTSRTQAVERYLRINITGTFSNLDLAVLVVKNLTSVTF